MSGQWDLLNSDIDKQNSAKSFDIILLQEPYIDFLGNPRATRAWKLIKPSVNPNEENTHPRSIILVNAKIPSDHWEEIHIKDGNRDVTAVQVKGQFGRLTLFNVYNDQNHSRTLNAIDNHITENRRKILSGDNDYIYLGGDFNRHHPLWENDANTQLLTARHIEKAQQIINIIGKYDLEQSLPKGTPTFYSNAHKSWTRPDNVFCSSSLTNKITICDVAKELITGPGVDHMPIITTIELSLPATKYMPRPNFRDTNWPEFTKELKKKIDRANISLSIDSIEAFHNTVNKLTSCIQETIKGKVKHSRPTPLSKRWWTADLARKKKEVRKLGAEHYKYRAIMDHPAHKQFRRASNSYSNSIKKQKAKHWEEYLTNALDKDTPTINMFITEPPTDGSSAHIPTLTYKDGRGVTKEASSNEEKAKLLSCTFFPEKPENIDIPENYAYPTPITYPCVITKSRIRSQINRLHPYKAPGPDGIPNAVWIFCIEIVLPYLTSIYRATMKLQTYSPSWREWTTVVLRKPGKPRYDNPKAWRPIALMNTMGKIMTALIAEDLLHMCEKHQLLPKHHFGGRPGRTTTDALHLLTHKIKAAIRRNKMVSVLFLDIEGAFPNAVLKRLLHNMRKRRIPEEYILFTKRQLENRRTKLSFDDYLSDWIPINNGMGQGDPASMFDYLIYDADLIDETLRLDTELYTSPPEPGSARDRGTQRTDKEAAAYVDNTWLMGIGNNLEESNATLKDMMERKGGALEWSTTHHSRFELTKTVLMEFTNKRERDPNRGGKWTPLTRIDLNIKGTTIKPSTSCRYLGIQIDQELKWHEQEKAAVGKATKWTLAFRRMAQPTKGVKAKLMRKLYNSVLIPKLTYGLDTWYRPTTKKEHGKRRKGSVGALKQFTKIQRMAAIAITGALRTTASDVLDIHAGIYPMELTVKKTCQRAAMRLATLPETHPLFKPIKTCTKKIVKKHPSPLHLIMALCPHNTEEIEKIKPLQRSLTYKIPATIRIPKSREDTKKLNEKDQAEAKIYTDGSGFEGGIGASAVMYRRNKSPRELKYHLGPDTTYTVANREAVGLCLGIHMISELLQMHSTPKSITFYVDSQATINGLKSKAARPGQHIKNKFLETIDEIKKKDPSTKFNEHWITAHDNVAGNERADELAKEAAKGESSPATKLPKYLKTRPLPKSKTAILQQLNKNLKEDWKELWKDSPRRKRMEKIDEKMPNSNFMKKTREMSRKGISILTQLRTGHVPLREFLHKINKEDSPTCQQCGYANETVTH